METRRACIYVCPVCSATKLVKAHTTQRTDVFWQEIPSEIFCGVKGCTGKAVPEEGAIISDNPKPDEEPETKTDTLSYDRHLLVDILIYHYRKDITSCGCGWAELGHSHAEHVADVYEMSLLAKGE